MRCPTCSLENPNDAQRCDCGFNFTTNRKETPILYAASGRSGPSSITQNSNNLAVSRAIGVALIFVGLFLSGYFTLFYETSIDLPKEVSEASKQATPPGIIPGRVNNLGLLQERQSGISSGLLLSILGALLLLYGKEQPAT